MSTKSESSDDPQQTDLTELGRALGDAIAATDAYQAFEEAMDTVERSETAQEKIRTFEQRRHEFMIARQNGDATEGDLVDLQRLQQELHQIPAMAEFLDAQASLNGRLEAVNEAISEPLNLDFGEQAGGCCHD